MVSQQDRIASFGPAPHPEPQDGAYFSQGESLYEDLMRRGLLTGLELGVGLNADFSRVFGMEADVQREQSVANRLPRLCDPPSVESATFPGLELFSQGLGAAGQGDLSVNTPAPSMPLDPSMLSCGTSDIPSYVPQENPLPSSSNTKPATFSTASLQRQRPVPKRSTPPIPPSKSKGAAKKRREDAIQQGRDLRRQLLADMGKSKVQLWELTMEQGVLTRMSKDDRLTKSWAWLVPVISLAAYSTFCGQPFLDFNS
jgi:hypothetical protein